jgi:hypothetical protein
VTSLLSRYWRPLVALVLILLGCWCIRQAGYHAADQEWRQRWTERDAADARAVAQRAAAERAEEQRRQRLVNEETERAEHELAAAHAAAERANAAAGGLRSELDKLQSRLHVSEQRRSAAVTDASQARAEAAYLLAELLRESDKAAGEYAEEADRSFTEGQACERIYDAIRNKHERTGQ